MNNKVFMHKNEPEISINNIKINLIPITPKVISDSIKAKIEYDKSCEKDMIKEAREKLNKHYAKSFPLFEMKEQIGSKPTPEIENVGQSVEINDRFWYKIEIWFLFIFRCKMEVYK